MAAQARKTQGTIEVIPGKNEEAVSVNRRWAVGDIFGIEIPADAETLLANGADFLTKAFQTSGAMPAGSNRVLRIERAEEFVGGGTGKKLLLQLSYETPETSLPNELFIKFSRNFDNELWDRARSLMISEAHFAVLSRSPDFPVSVPACLFADIDRKSGTGLIISERIPYGSSGIEPIYPKCMDYAVPNQVEHYKAILKGLAKLSGAHKGGRLSAEFDKVFPYKLEQASAAFAAQTPADIAIQRANRMFEFVTRYPRLFPENVRTAEFREQFIRDIPDVVAAGDRIRDVLFGKADFIAFAHWNANIDNCWFWRDLKSELQCGFIDWANVGQLSVAQSINGAIGGAEPAVWNEHLDELLHVYANEFEAQGGPRLDFDELQLHTLLIVASSGLAYSMRAPVAIEREIKDIDSIESYQDRRFSEHENARIQLHMMTKMLNVWQTRKLGDVVRALA